LRVNHYELNATERSTHQDLRPRLWQWRRNEFESGGTGPAQSAENIFFVPLHFFGSKSTGTIRFFSERFFDGQYSLISFLLAVFLLTVRPRVPQIGKVGQVLPPPRAQWSRSRWTLKLSVPGRKTTNSECARRVFVPIAQSTWTMRKYVDENSYFFKLVDRFARLAKLCILDSYWSD